MLQLNAPNGRSQTEHRDSSAEAADGSSAEIGLTEHEIDSADLVGSVSD